MPLLTGIRTLLALIIGVAGADVALRLWGIGAFDSMLNASDTTRVDRFDHISQVLGITSFLLFVACGICWLIWQAKLAGLTPGYVKWSPGWHVGAWFIPVAGLWWPYRNMRDLGVLYLAPRWRSLTAAWWVVFVVDEVLGRVIAYMHAPTSAAALKHYEAWFVVTDVLDVAAAVLAAVLVTRLTTGAAIVLVPEGRATAG